MNEVNKLARTVLRGGRGSNAPDLPDVMSGKSWPHRVCEPFKLIIRANSFLGIH